jgi:EAL domain-containing protein (putative c-di-GMP-specific phosphodiesterase class I)
MKQADSTAAILQTVRERGVQVALDDFGTGYSSLSYLRKFPIDALKIDQSFVNHIDAAAGDASIVTAVISMARSLNLRVVAEGVETPEQLAFLQVHRCDQAQGYLSSKPVQPQNFAKLLRRNTPLLSPLPARSSRFGDPPPRAAQVRRVAGAAAGRAAEVVGP